MEIKELFEALAGQQHLYKRMTARLYVIFVDEIIDERDYEEALTTMSHVVMDNDVESGLHDFYLHDTHIRDQIYKVLNDLYFS